MTSKSILIFFLYFFRFFLFSDIYSKLIIIQWTYFFMVYREHFAHPHKLAKLIHDDLHIDINKIIRWLAHELIDEAHGDTHELYGYFSHVYDELYHSILFEKIHLHTETRELLEILATPLFHRSIPEQEQIIDTYIS